MLLILFALALSFDEPYETTVFTNGDEGSLFWRIPTIVTLKDGSLLLCNDKRWNSKGDLPNKVDVVVKRSTDGGKTWGPSIYVAEPESPLGYGDASLVVDQDTGDVLCIFNGEVGFFDSTAENPIRVFVSKSKDNGQTWSQKVDITSQLYGKGCPSPERAVWEAMFLTAGHTLQLRSGRIICGGVARLPSTSVVSAIACYSDDFGTTWNVAIEPAASPGDESKFVELNNGDVLASIRKTPYRSFAISHTKGLTWEEAFDQPDIHEPGCNADMVRYTSVKDGYDKNRILHTIVYNSETRINTTVLLSYDEGKTWPVKKVIYPGKSDVSGITVRQDGMIVLYYEKEWNDGFNQTISIFSLEWLTDGNDKYTPPNRK
ncbi:secreted sialidase [Tritrichomonas foetus]|uniref:Secreted sialidase n=1 Tax=Tritrichomonas foetus TaxID=1144522 RepID=A0A1J4K0D4_9EUKA|nr:secreted sialidase [Tritrichomonas foetus]|eukprot:OHT03198.1 secreted sialidase [Tritrichomonas foetus]